MVEKRLRVETLSELQIWIEGKFDLIGQAQSTAHEDLTNVRRVVHDLANNVAVITALNIPDKILALQDADKDHKISIESFSRDAAERRGALAALKVMYAVGGAFAAGIFAIAVEVYRSLI